MRVVVGIGAGCSGDEREKQRTALHTARTAAGEAKGWPLRLTRAEP